MVNGNFKIFLLVFINILLFSSTSYAQLERDQKHILVSMRMIGHEILLHLGDSISRVLPIEKKEFRYKILFESGFQFKPEKLASIIDSVIKKTRVAKNYIVEVEKCNTTEVVYSYEIGDSTNTDLIPCGTRMQPKACYAVFITLLDNKNSVSFLQTALPGQKNGPNASKTQAQSLLIALPILALCSFIGLIVFFRKKSLTASSNNYKVDAEIVSIGDYRFDKKDMALSYGDEKTVLSGKEADLLFLLYTNENKTLKREHILKMVWGDEGDYVGRTVDVFISKLRKKLGADSSVKIVNIRGIGYKFIIN